MAEKWLQQNHPGNRAIGWARVESFVADILADAWRCTHQAICFDADRRLIDGQHRLHAIVHAKKGAWLFVAQDPQGDIHAPIDRHAPRSIAFLTGISAREASALALLYRMESGIPNTNVPVTVAETEEMKVHYEAAFKVIREAPVNSNAIVSGLRAACAWAMPIDEPQVVDFMCKAVTGEMIKRGDPAYAFRLWQDWNRPRAMEVVFAALNCIRFHIHGRQLRGVFTGEMGYRASCGRRRALKAPHTPSADLVVGVSWPMGTTSTWRRARRRRRRSRSP